MSNFKVGNIVNWKSQFYIVGDNPTEKSLCLIPFNSSNTTSHPSTNWPNKVDGIQSVHLVADTLYGWLLQCLIINPLGIAESLSANGWIPR